MIENEIVTFKVKHVIILNVPLILEILLNHKSHVTKGKINKIPKNDEVIVIAIHPDSVIEIKLFLFHKLVKILFVAFKFAGLRTIYNITILLEKRITISILEKLGRMFDIIRNDLKILF